MKIVWSRCLKAVFSKQELFLIQRLLDCTLTLYTFGIALDHNIFCDNNA